MNIYVWNGGENDGEIATRGQVAEFGRHNPCFEVWTLQAASETLMDADTSCDPRSIRVAIAIAERFANRGSERASRALREALQRRATG